MFVALLPLAFVWLYWTGTFILVGQLPSAVPSQFRVAPHWHELMQERWLSVEEIAAHLGVNRDTIYK